MIAMTDENADRDERLEVLFREKAQAVENAARKIGLYMQDAGLVGAPADRPDMPADTPVMVATFTIGDVAFSDRVLNPENDSIDSEFRKMAVQAEKEKFNDLRDELEKKLREGKGIFDEEE